MAIKQLKPDQERAVRNLFAFYASGQTKDKNPLIGMPTGYGKSLVIAEFTKQMFYQWPNSRVLISTHVKELIRQNTETLLQQWPTAPLGICSAGLKSRDTMHPIIIGGIKSMYNSRQALGHRNMMLVDEVQLVGTDENAQYLKFIAEQKTRNPYFTVAGLSATLYRAGSGQLVGNDSGIFTDVVLDCTTLHEFNRILDEGWLCRLIPKRTETEFSVEGLNWDGDDYNQGQAQAIVDKTDVTIACCREMIAQKAAENRRSCLVFAQGVEHADHIVECLRMMGQNALAVHDRVSADDRDFAVTSFKNGTLDYLVNNNVLTTGFDYPGLDMISVMRLIGNPGLWVQILGRGTRPEYNPLYPISWTLVDEYNNNLRLAAIANSRKPNCLVLDFAGNTKRLGPINDPILPKRRGKRSGGNGIAPIKICPLCGTYNHASVMRCGNPACDAEFSREQKIFASASQDELIRSSEPIYETRQVTGVSYTVKVKNDKPMMVVSYHDGNLVGTPFREYVLFEHTKVGRNQAVSWWMARSDSVVPDTVEKAIQQQNFLKVPKAIRIRTDSEYPRITEYLWE